MNNLECQLKIVFQFPEWKSASNRYYFRTLLKFTEQFSFELLWMAMKFGLLVKSFKMIRFTEKIIGDDILDFCSESLPTDLLVP